MAIGETLISAGTSLLGGLLSSSSNKSNAEKNIAMQKEFAQNGVRWKVEDAKAAGVHPLYALGANTTSFAPVSFGNTSMGPALASMGQDVGRAINATRTEPERVTAYSQAAQKLQLDNMGLQNQLLASKIATLNQAGMPPAMAGIKPQPHEITGRDPANPNQELQSVPDVGYARTRKGYAAVPSKDVKERIEDNLIQEVMWAVRNNLMPSLGINQSPPNFDSKPGHSWRFNPITQEYYQQPHSSAKARYKKLR